MPAGFNTGQIEYIKAIANVNGHKTYKDVAYNRNASASAVTHLNQQTADNMVRYGVWCLGKKPVLRDSSGNIGVTTLPLHELDAFNIPKAANSDGVVDETQREGDEGFLESTHLNMRLLLPHLDGTSTFTQDHTEFRMIVFRARDRQHHLETHLKDTNNFMFNLFRGNRNHAIGFSGHQEKEEVAGNLSYIANSTAGDSGLFNVQGQDAMTVPINKESWMVMRDHRFYLGKEYGGKNIYEDSFHWDWKDPIATSSPDVTETDNEKNYTWYIALISNNNSLTAQDSPLVSVRFTGTTHMTSG